MADVTHEVVVSEDDASMRIDRMLANHIEDLSRTRIKALIEAGQVTLRELGSDANEIITDPSLKLKEGQEIRIIVPETQDHVIEAQDMDLDVLYEDAELIVINKPVGLVVHPAPGHRDGTLVNALLYHCGDSLTGIGGLRRPGIVHRIDKDTSGVMIAAKTDAAYVGLQAQFADHSIERAYHAIVWGLPHPTSGTIEGNIGRSERNRQKMAIQEGKGRHAITHYRTLEILGNVGALLECRLETGRTHQIRVHLTHMGHGVIGDTVYGRARKARKGSLPEAARAILQDYNHQALHAKILGFKHPISGESLTFEAEPPDEFKALLGALRSV